ncbi:uncharacterized protein PGTG_07715 [Puccinia graminis f. sp. tritici CRL 75-36-700-3]|uniref:Uncharacterized protein n=1 Tax=Puccinia graminis f. sp. tritici (strain CRL 75-36-700-3 / race SCCL) TaxID=418459 RepID=E3KDA4_PUCGT|nr:uncharacterized protein PGTG_07715 [Puccinia graminis f. sp. tritici CRL 75-36-700-3]EFP82318.2 hypothetical protein PGTG_07715 [Puccinia graminis f. sp. tritici CRL 75-36-700-3]
MATLTREQRLHIQEYADAATAIWQQIVKNPNTPPFQEAKKFLDNVPKLCTLICGHRAAVRGA